MPRKRPKSTPSRRSRRPTAADQARARQLAAREAAQARAGRSQPRGKRPPRTRWQKVGVFGTWAGRFLLYSVIFGIAAIVGGTVAAVPVLPHIEHSSVFSQHTGGVYARDNTTLLRELRAPTSRRYVPDGQVPPLVLDATVAAEDRRFYQHGGLDVRGIARALVTDLRTRHAAQGASTITQQLVKNAYVGPERSVGRKTREALLALALDEHWSKQRIITAYLNTAYFGQGAYGVQDGARLWFGKHLDTLTPAQAALLAGLLQAPEGNNPLTNPVGIHARRDIVLHTMHDLGKITQAELTAGLAEPIPNERSIRRRQKVSHELAPHFTDDVIGHLVSKFGTARALGGGLRVTTTIDARMQRKANTAVQLINKSGLSTALVSIDIRTGQVRAMALGGPAAHSAFNVATLGHRQPGSAFKPFTLAAALEHGYSAASVVISAPYRQTINGEHWDVHNAEAAYAGKERLDRATWHSDNTVYARVASAMGIDKVIDAARRAGVTSRIDNVPATVLGALPDGVTPVEIASAYATFPRLGVTIPRQFDGPVTIKRAVQPGVGQVLSAPASGKPTSTGAPTAANPLDTSATDTSATVDTTDVSGNERAFSPAVSSEVTEVLRGVVRAGTATRAQIGRPAAGKTGTTDSYVDAWFVGYTPEYVTAVWVGNTAGAIPMRTQWGGGPVFGGTYPAEIWQRFMGSVLDGRPVRQFPTVDVHRVNVLIDPATGLVADKWCSGAVTESFIEGTQPTAQSTTCPQKTITMPDVVGLTLKAAQAVFDRLGLKVEVTQLTTSTTGAGTVVQQVPAAGEQVAHDAIVRLFVPVVLAPPTSGGTATTPGTPTGTDPGDVLAPGIDPGSTTPTHDPADG